jgi:transcriptional regulator with XRE-family HTH domain
VVNPTLKRLLARLKQLRKAHGLSQEQFSEMAGISYKYYQQVEAGRKRELRLSTLERLAKAYGIQLWELLSPNEPNGKPNKKAAGPREKSKA